MEQRIKALEEEVKLLKNEIKAVLLDIKESLAGGEWVMAGQPGTVEKGEASRAEEKVEEKETEEAGMVASKKAADQAAGAGKEGQAYGAPSTREKPYIPGNREERMEPQAGQHEGIPAGAAAEKRDGGMDVLTLMRLIEWLEKSRQEIGREETEKLVRIYADSGKLQEEEGKALRLVNGIWGSDENGTLVDSLMELDKIMRQQGDSRTLQSILVRMISDGHDSSHGYSTNHRERMDRTANG